MGGGKLRPYVLTGRQAGVSSNREDAKAAKKSDTEEVAAIVVDSAIKVHRALGPGLNRPCPANRGCVV